LSRRPVLWIVGLVALFLGACGPILFMSQVTSKAEKAVSAAKVNQGDRWAPYEYFGAEAYLEQAKWRAAYGDFHEAYRYGKKAEEMANKATKLTRIRSEEESDKARPPVRPPAPAREEPAREEER
jgi:hypothetical protein